MKYKNTKVQGDAGLGAAIAYFSLLGYTVSIPLSDSQDYDLIVDFNGKLNKVQVKTSNSKQTNGSFRVTLKVSGGNKSRASIKRFCDNTCDYLFVLLSNGNKYLIPRADIRSDTTITIGIDYQEFLCKGE
jgi:hypothetical protein